MIIESGLAYRLADADHPILLSKEEANAIGSLLRHVLFTTDNSIKISEIKRNIPESLRQKMHEDLSVTFKNKDNAIKQQMIVLKIEPKDQNFIEILEQPYRKDDFRLEKVLEMIEEWCISNHIQLPYRHENNNTQKPIIKTFPDNETYNVQSNVQKNGESIGINVLKNGEMLMNLSISFPIAREISLKIAHEILEDGSHRPHGFDRDFSDRLLVSITEAIKNVDPERDRRITSKIDE